MAQNNHAPWFIECILTPGITRQKISHPKCVEIKNLISVQICTKRRTSAIFKKSVIENKMLKHDRPLLRPKQNVHFYACFRQVKVYQHSITVQSWDGNLTVHFYYVHFHAVYFYYIQFNLVQFSHKRAVIASFIVTLTVKLQRSQLWYSLIFVDQSGLRRQ